MSFRWLSGHLFWRELFVLFAAGAFRGLSSVRVFGYFPFGFEGRIWDLIVSVPDHYLSFYFTKTVTAWLSKGERIFRLFTNLGYTSSVQRRILIYHCNLTSIRVFRDRILDDLSAALRLCFSGGIFSFFLSSWFRYFLSYFDS